MSPRNGLKTFPKGGIHPAEHKAEAADKPIKPIPLPNHVILPISQHTGAPCEPVVKKGDHVKTGQLIADSKQYVSAPVHATISGTVGEITHYPHPLGARVIAIPITSDGQDEWAEGILKEGSPATGAYDDVATLREKIRSAGIVGLGGAAFPTHVKLNPPKDKPIDTFICNGAECEPYLTGDYRLMLEQPEQIVEGCRIVMAVLGVKRCLIAVEDNKRDAAERVRQRIPPDSGLSVLLCATKYPQGGEKQLVKALLNREVPSAGLPLDVGVVVQNVGTCVSIYQAVAWNKPLIERIVTVTGPGVREPENLLVRIGTKFADILNVRGAAITDGAQVIMGGPMMGKAQWTLDVPVVKGTSGIVVLRPEDVVYFEEANCLRCGRCIQVCPMGLMPNLLADYTRNEQFEELKALGVLDCMECGSCAYVCPANRRLIHWIRIGKFEYANLKQNT